MTLDEAAQILGISTNATAKEELNAFRRLALRWHPDRNQDNPKRAAEMMRKINEAHNIFKKHLENSQARNPRRPGQDTNPRQPRRPQSNPSSDPFPYNDPDLKQKWYEYQEALREHEGFVQDVVVPAYALVKQLETKVEAAKVAYQKNPTAANKKTLHDIEAEYQRAKDKHEQALKKAGILRGRRDTLLEHYNKALERRQNQDSDPGQTHPGHDDNQHHDATIQALWNLYQQADKKYREYGPELTKAFNEKVRQQERLKAQQNIYEKSPTVENFQKLSDILLDYNRAIMNHNTAKFTLQKLKMERDLWYDEYNKKVREYNEYKQPEHEF